MQLAITSPHDWNQKKLPEHLCQTIQHIPQQKIQDDLTNNGREGAAKT